MKNPVVFLNLNLTLADSLKLELCADELVVGGGVGGVRPDERALKQRTRWTGVFFLVLQGSATSPVISARPLAPNS